MTLSQALAILDDVKSGETIADYKKRMKRIKKYTDERDFLIDAIGILTSPEDECKRELKVARLAIVEKAISELL